MTFKNHYATLRVPVKASPNQIKAAYRMWAFKFHPDRNDGSPESEAQFKEIGTAYGILSDPAKRAQYNRTLVAKLKQERVSRPVEQPIRRQPQRHWASVLADTLEQEQEKGRAFVDTLAEIFGKGQGPRNNKTVYSHRRY